MLNWFKKSCWLQWDHGRQMTGYDKMLLAKMDWPVSFDLYVLKYPKGSSINRHTDRVWFGNHHRINVVLKNAIEGGEFVCEKAIINKPRIKYFRPDIHSHLVTEVKEGSRYVLSLGWIRL